MLALDVIESIPPRSIQCSPIFPLTLSHSLNYCLGEVTIRYSENLYRKTELGKFVSMNTHLDSCIINNRPLTKVRNFLAIDRLSRRARRENKYSSAQFPISLPHTLINA